MLEESEGVGGKVRNENVFLSSRIESASFGCGREKLEVLVGVRIVVVV